MPNVYAHWLDGELFHPRCQAALSIRTERIETLLKLHLLFGNHIRISDIQLSDCSVLLKLFVEPSFRQLLVDFPDSLRLVASTDHKSEKLGCVLSGLLRAMKTRSWISASFSTPEIPKGVAKALAPERDEWAAKARLSELRRKRVPGRDKQLYLGLINALDHFLGESGRVTPYEPKKRTSYFDVLSAAEAKLSNRSQERVVVGSTIQYCSRLSDPGSRSQFVTSINLSDPEHRRYYAYVIQAWNFAVANSINPNRQSAYGFRGSYPIATVFGELKGYTGPVTTDAADVEPFENFERVDWSPSDLSWSAVLDMRHECHEQIRRYQSTIGKPANAKHLRDLVRGLAAKSVPARKLPGEAWFELFLDWGVGAEIGLLLGNHVLGMPLPPVALGEGIAVGHFLKGVKKLRRKRIVKDHVESISSDAIRYNITHANVWES